jgi:hypothetical protein
LAGNDKLSLTKRVWRGQLAVLFPWIEERRREVENDGSHWLHQVGDDRYDHCTDQERQDRRRRYAPVARRRHGISPSNVDVASYHAHDGAPMTESP